MDLLDVPGRQRRVGGDEVDIQLQSVCPCLLHLAGVGYPSFRRDSVERRDYGNPQRLAGLADVVEIGFGTEFELLHLGEV